MPHSSFAFFVHATSEFRSHSSIIASVAFMVAEIFIPSFGALGIGGMIGFVTGSVLLINDQGQPDLGISMSTIVSATVLLIGCMLGISWFILKNLRSRNRSGIETLIGMEAEAVEHFVAGRGQIRIQGEYWNATEIDRREVKNGHILLVVAIDGLNLRVKLRDLIEKET